MMHKDIFEAFNETLLNCIDRIQMQAPAEQLFAEHPELGSITSSFTYHVSPMIENPTDGRPLIDIAIETAITSFYRVTAKDPLDFIKGKHAYLNVLLTRASMLPDFEIRQGKTSWDAFGYLGITDFLYSHPASTITYGINSPSFDLNAYRSHILRIITTDFNLEQLQIPFEQASKVPEFT